MPTYTPQNDRRLALAELYNRWGEQYPTNIKKHLLAAESKDPVAFLRSTSLSGTKGESLAPGIDGAVSGTGASAYQRARGR